LQVAAAAPAAAIHGNEDMMPCTMQAVLAPRQ
jgi:hypothetical protein